MSNSTPMQKLKHHINQMISFTSNDFSVVRLNRASKKYNPHRFNYGGGYSLGVDSDHLIVFQSNTSNFSFGLKFNFIDLDEDDWTCQFSFKKFSSKHNLRDRSYDDDEEKIALNKTIQYSPEYSTADFKSIISKFLSESLGGFDRKGESPSNVEGMVLEFIKKNVQENGFIEDFDVKFSARSNEIKEEHAELISYVSTLDVKVCDAKKLMDTANNLVNSSLLQCDSYKLCEDLQEQLCKARIQLEKETVNLNELHNTGLMEKEYYMAFRDHAELKGTLDSKIKLEIKKSTAFLRTKLSQLFNL